MLAFRVTHLDTGRVLTVLPGEPDMSVPTLARKGRSIGVPGSGSALEIDEPLEGVELGIFAVSSHVLLRGSCSPSRAKELPEIAVDEDGPSWMERVLASDPIETETSWSSPREGNACVIANPFLDSRRPGDIYVRFDGRPLRIGRHVIEMGETADRD